MARMLYLGDDVTLPGSGYPPIAAFSIPYAANAVGAHFLASGEGVALKNFGTAGDATKVGNPNFSATRARLDGENYIQTAIPESLAMTYVGIFRRSSATVSTAFIGNYDGGSEAGASFYSTGTSANIQGNARRAGATSGIVQTGADTTAYAAYALSIPATGGMSIYNLTTGSGNVSSATAARELGTVRPLRMGRFYETGFTGQSDQVVQIVYNRALSGAEVREVGLFCAEYAASVGLTVAIN